MCCVVVWLYWVGVLNVGEIVWLESFLGLVVVCVELGGEVIVDMGELVFVFVCVLFVVDVEVDYYVIDVDG